MFNHYDPDWTEPTAYDDRAATDYTEQHEGDYWDGDEEAEFGDDPDPALF